MPTTEKIKDIIKAGSPDIFIESSRKYQNALIRHTADEGVVAFLEMIDRYENANQLDLRQRNYISTKHVIGFIQRPADNIWSALGGSFAWTGSDGQKDKLLEQLSTANSGKPLQSYIQEEYFNSIYDNPAGGTWITWDDAGENIEVYQIDIKSIKKYERYGNGVKWILFEPEVIKTVTIKEKDKDVPKDVKRYTYVDSDYVIYIDEVDGIAKVHKKTKNPYGFVPFVLNTTVTGKANMKSKLNKSAKFDIKVPIPLSVIDNEMQLMDAYLRKTSTKEIHEFLHAYPDYWKYISVCPECEGAGDFPTAEGKAKCTSCGGNGLKLDKKDVTRFTALAPPNTDNGEAVLAPPSGYVVPPIEIVEDMRVELDYKLNDIYKSHWGTPFTTEARAQGEPETATGRLIDIQPTITRLNRYTDQIESTHNTIIRYIIRIMFPATSEKVRAFKSYGRGFIIETGEVALKKYEEGKTAGLSVTLLYQLLLSYYATQFRSDEMKFMTVVKLANVEPFIHQTSNEVQELEDVKLIDKQTKYYYSDWLAQMTEQELRTDTEKDLRDKLDEYVKIKIQDNGTEN